jgi:lipoprotein-anchoring transpeptidase ErfK/SrfK
MLSQLCRVSLATAFLVAPSLVSGAQSAAPASAPSPRAARMQQLFASAATDPAAIVPLILEGSAALTTLPTVEARALGDALEPYCARAFFGPEKLPEMGRLDLGIHVVEKGDNGTKIAQHYGIGTGMLGLLNAGYDERKLHVGQELKVLNAGKGISITVARSQFRLSTWLDLGAGAHALVQFVPVGVGAAESPTPLGRTTIVKRVLNPTWTDPDSHKTFAAGDPDNVLGGYWIALDSVGIDRSGIGLHGYTGAPQGDWISKGASHGCVRMLQADIDHVYHVALEGTPVTIVE